MMDTTLSSIGISALCAGILVLAGCAPGYMAPEVSAELVRHSNASPVQLQRGYEMHQATCAKCHPFEDPNDYFEDEIRDEIMPVMGRKSKFSPADEQAVLEYLLAVRKMPVPEVEAR